MLQHVVIHTRMCESQASSIWDLTITNEDNVIENLIAADLLGKSDHIVMEHKYNHIYSVRLPESKNTKY